MMEKNHETEQNFRATTIDLVKKSARSTTASASATISDRTLIMTLMIVSNDHSEWDNSAHTRCQ
jgi:hypothetical protein